MRHWIVFLALLANKLMACGSWQYEDVDSQQRFRFKQSGVELINEKGSDPKFMQSGRDKAFFTQGDRLRLKNGTIFLSKLTGKTSAGRRTFKTTPIAILNNSLLKLNTGEIFQLKFNVENKEVIALSASSRPLGKGILVDSCKNEADIQLHRVSYLLIWKSLKIDPFAAKAENWWW